MSTLPPETDYLAGATELTGICVVIRNCRDGSQRVMRYGYGEENASECARYDLLIAIDAPEQLPIPEDAMQIYLDPGSSAPRSLHGKAWQIRSAQDMDTANFDAWAQEVAGLLAQMLVEQGLVCVDLTDIAVILGMGKQPFSCTLCDWQDPAVLPEAMLGNRFNRGFWVISAQEKNLRIELIERVYDLMDQVFSEDAIPLVATCLQSGGGTRLMLVGV